MKTNPPDVHQSFLKNVLPVFQSDERILGIAAAGSWISQSMDEYSDLDLILICDDSAFSAVMDDRLKISAKLGTLLTAFTGEHVGEPRLLICLFDEPLLHVDLKFVSLSDFSVRIEDPIILWERTEDASRQIALHPSNHPMPDLQWIEDRFWVWVHYGALRLGRGEILEVLDFIAFLRSTVLGPLALVSTGNLPRGVRRIEKYCPEYLSDFKSTVATYDRSSCKRALLSCADFYRKLKASYEYANLIPRCRAEMTAIKYLESIDCSV